jgi:hypothetical protein
MTLNPLTKWLNSGRNKKTNIEDSLIMLKFTIDVLNVIRKLFNMFSALCKAQWSCDRWSDSPQKLMGKLSILAIS